MSKVKGKVVGVKKNKEYETKSGKTYNAHLLVLEDEDGEQVKYKVNVKTRPAKFVADLKEGEKVTVETGGEYNNVVAVRSESRQFARSNRGGSDPTGAIQGMILKSAVDLAIASSQGLATTSKDIVCAAKLVLEAKETVDKLVVEALKSKDEDEGDDDDLDYARTHARELLTFEDRGSSDDDDEEIDASKSKRKRSREEIY